VKDWILGVDVPRRNFILHKLVRLNNEVLEVCFFLIATSQSAEFVSMCYGFDIVINIV